MSKELGKKKFEELLGGLVYKPKGKPVLVSDDDKRPEYSNVTIDDLNDMLLFIISKRAYRILLISI